MRLRQTGFAIILVATCMLPGFAPPAPPEPAEAPAAGDNPAGQLIEALNADDNGISIDPQARTIDLLATVCLRECEFLEQLACSQDTREHESLLVLHTPPSLIHAAMLLMQLEPGAPMRWVEEGEGFRMIPPRGPEVGVTLITVADDGEEVHTPANEWVCDQTTGETMRGNTWLFTGSTFTVVNCQELYVADLYGTAISLVNFGDDLLARAGSMTQNNDDHGRVWGPRTQVIPEIGTEVRVRLTLPKPSTAGSAPGPDPPPAAPSGAGSGP